MTWCSVTLFLKKFTYVNLTTTQDSEQIMPTSRKTQWSNETLKLFFWFWRFVNLKYVNKNDVANA